MKRVLMVSPHFPPDTSAASHRVRLLAPHLPEFGWEPTVVTVEKEVIKEVPKEVIRTETKTVTVEAISPISYAVIGVGVVLVVVAGVMMSRRKKV